MLGVVTVCDIASCDQRFVCVQLSNLTSLPGFHTFFQRHQNHLSTLHPTSIFGNLFFSMACPGVVKGTRAPPGVRFNIN